MREKIEREREKLDKKTSNRDVFKIDKHNKFKSEGRKIDKCNNRKFEILVELHEFAKETYRQSENRYYRLIHKKEYFLRKKRSTVGGAEIGEGS